ncbi:MAG: hypothetical protein V4659_04140 [Pseudomonadota bacterium]
MTATETFYIKRGDRLPLLRRPLLAPDGGPLDLTGATVVLNVRARGGAMKVTNAACTVIAPAAAGVVEYGWAAIDTDTAGTFDAEFTATFAGLPITVPNKGFLQIEIGEDLR